MKKTAFAAFLLSLTFTVVQGNGETVPPEEFNCLEQPSFGEILNFSVPGDCTSYYACSLVDNIVKRYYCDDGLNFNPIVQTCGWPEDLLEPCVA